MKLKRTAQRIARTNNATKEAFFYESPKSIEVYMHPMDAGRVLSCRIPRAMLADWLKRTEPKP